MGRDNLSRLAPPLVGGVIALCLIAYVVSTVRNFGRASVPGNAMSSRGTAQSKEPAGLRRVELRPALLCDYYEHGVEHAPPRDPSGVMQKRELNYRAPADPFRLLRSTLLTDSLADTALRATMEAWEAGWRRGASTNHAVVAAAAGRAAESSAGALTVLEVGRAFAFLDGDATAVPFIRSALAKAESEFKDSRPGDVQSLALLHRLDELKALWRLEDYAGLEKRFALAMKLHPPLSQPARRARHMFAEMLYYQHRYVEAADEIMHLQREHDQVGDLGSADPSDLPEMNWVRGLLLHAAARYSDAIPPLRAAVDGPRFPRESLLLLMQSFIEIGQVEDAERCHKRYVDTYSPPPSVARDLRWKLDALKYNPAGVRIGAVSGGLPVRNPASEP